MEGAMLARKQCPNVSKYVSDRVFDGVRPLPPAQVAKLRASYNRAQAHNAVWVVWLARAAMGHLANVTGRLATALHISF
jgi:hypothetical protein